MTSSFPSTSSYESEYTIRIPKPDLSTGELRFLANVETPKGRALVYITGDQIVTCFQSQWYIQPDNYTFDSLADILGVAPRDIEFQDDELWCVNSDDIRTLCDERSTDEFRRLYWTCVAEHYKLHTLEFSLVLKGIRTM